MDSKTIRENLSRGRHKRYVINSSQGRAFRVYMRERPAQVLYDGPQQRLGAAGCRVELITGSLDIENELA